ncbi:hypothetical protein IQ35_00483 [Sphingobium wenxiniae]|uniref:Uncharacterized protein n=1 Tax=Sphingobium wenxiniae (strain DSM 21828 / CGMCC 1.7748 / JZ-1) TaxID=595605 RepID=A0A562KME3_SPHWJ|nr:hypothetical protein [Sphingobium wenxiniae]TWH96552.1 hypothetical protein IQ35_00483 [Sphingobium wenxiniae]
MTHHPHSGTYLPTGSLLDENPGSTLSGNQHTEIFVDGQWLPLPISQDDVVIFPGSQAHKAYGIAPTLHRVIQARDAGDMDDAEPSNITLLLGAK